MDNEPPVFSGPVAVDTEPLPLPEVPRTLIAPDGLVETPDEAPSVELRNAAVDTPTGAIWLVRLTLGLAFPLGL